MTHPSPQTTTQTDGPQTRARLLGKDAEENRGEGAQKVELEKRLDHNSEAVDPATATADDRRPHAEPSRGKQDRGRSIQTPMDDTLDDSFPASDPPARSSPTTAGTNRRQ